MANSFSKQEVVAFDKVLEGFDDALVISKLFTKFNVAGEMAERANNTIWRPQPYIAQVFTGLDQTSNFNRNYAQLSVPTTLSYQFAAPLTLSATELRDALQEERLGKAAMQRLASQINLSCSNLAALTGTLVIPRTTAATGFDDIAACDTTMNRQGVNMDDRKMVLSSQDYNSMASNLAGRQNLVAAKTLNAYEKAKVGEVAGFDTYKSDYSFFLPAAVATGVTITNTLPLYYTPQATVTSADGLTKNNVDNRFQNISVNVTSGQIQVGDAFRIAGVNASHHITKQTTGFQKTFRVTGIVSGGGGTGVIQISPPIISNGGGTDPEAQYQNVAATPANGAALTFINTVAAPANPFWQADAFEIMPGRYVPDPNAGMAVMAATTDSGITVTMAKQASINQLNTLYRWDVFYGLVNLQPEMTGIELFNQNVA